MTVSISAVIALNDDPRAAARFYAEGFHSNIKPNSTTLTIGGMDFELIENGNRRLTPAVSFMVRFAPGQENQLRRLWEHLMAGDETISGGATLMPLTSYDFSPLFGWLVDGNGVNWQLMIDSLTSGGCKHGRCRKDSESRRYSLLHVDRRRTTGCRRHCRLQPAFRVREFHDARLAGHAQFHLRRRCGDAPLQRFCRGGRKRLPSAWPNRR